ncbi:MAG: ubiquinone biosynthesis accessory factor UbiJ [Hylemonella sp.]
MVTQSPFSFLDDAIQKVGSQLQPPEWALQEAQRRMVLLLNHVLQQEPEATARLARVQGKVVLFHWRQFHFRLLVTPAGLLDLAAPEVHADLTLSVTEESSLALLQSALGGARPSVRIEGDVDLAGAVNWVVEHVRWDLEEDLARLIGDAPAHALGQAARRLRDGVQAWLSRVRKGGP